MTQGLPSETAYEVELSYLEYDGTSDRLSIPIQIRERHLTPETTDAVLQGIGVCLQVTIWSDRDHLIIRLPFNQWRATRPYSGSLAGPSNGLLSVGRFDGEIDNNGDSVPARISAHTFDEP